MNTLSQLHFRLRHQPELDADFQPASLWTQAYYDLASELGERPVEICLLRPDGTGSVHRDVLLPAVEEYAEWNRLHLERTIKFLLWSRGGSRIYLIGASELIPFLSQAYSPGGERAFDYQFVDRLFGDGLTIQEGYIEPVGEPKGEDSSDESKLKGCRIGFDLGGSDRKCAAVIDGEVVYSEEVPWDPYFEADPSYHYEGIMDSLKLAAVHLPRVDAIGGSAAGVYVDNRVKVASLFRGVPAPVFERRVENMFLEIAREWGDVPFRVVNDGDVSALAGAMSLGDGGVLGLAMGTSTAVGYVDLDRRINGWLSELAFVPIDYCPDAPADEWSGDQGCAVQYLSQQGVSRLIPKSRLKIDPVMGKPEQLVEVQNAMKAGDERAARIYRTLGSYLGYAIPQFARFYEMRHLQLLGRVLSGEGGCLLMEQAQKVLQDEFPDLAEKVILSTPDEKTKRHGQAIAAASLPEIR
ncbi:ROK family protein [Roseibacillus persicicus]|uniref:ROK family protein n=1 Tax=Roseibacillus persicicus TaxID=454148 RepID=UPI00281096C3|nr:ROK family protein [Roseibacillus persicicus]MDQ8189803.1 ROK family protein [Roseibacillus persicicus]